MGEVPLSDHPRDRARPYFQATSLPHMQQEYMGQTGSAESNPWAGCFLGGARLLELTDDQTPDPEMFRVNSRKVDVRLPRKVDIRLPGKGNSNSFGARPVYSF